MYVLGNGGGDFDMAFMDILNNYQTLIVLILTIALICITAYYAWQTHKMNKLVKESSEYERRPIIEAMCKYDEFHRPNFGAVNTGKNIGEDVSIEAHVAIGIAKYGQGLESHKNRLILDKDFNTSSIPILLPQEECYIGAFEDILTALGEKKLIKTVPGDEACYHFDSYGNKIVFPYRYEFDWDLLSEEELVAGDIYIQASFKPDRDASKVFKHKRNFHIQIVRGLELANTNRVYKNFVVITTHGLMA